MRLFTLLTSYGLVSFQVARAAPNAFVNIYEGAKDKIAEIEKGLPEQRAAVSALERQIANSQSGNFRDLNGVMDFQQELSQTIMTHPQISQLATVRERALENLSLEHPFLPQSFSQIYDIEIRLRDLRVNAIPDLVKVQLKALSKKYNIDVRLLPTVREYLINAVTVDMDSGLLFRMKSLANLMYSYSEELGIPKGCEADMVTRSDQGE